MHYKSIKKHNKNDVIEVLGEKIDKKKPKMRNTGRGAELGCTRTQIALLA
jgi:hypothetical protein